MDIHEHDIDDQLDDQLDDPDAVAAELAADARERAERGLAWLMVVGGGVALAAAFALILERIELLKDPTYVPLCNFSPILSCGSVMTTDQAALLGFPNPLIGLMAFPVVITTGVVLLARVRLPRWYWAGLQAGVTLGAVLIGWLIVQSLYVIGALCPYCMVVWAVVIPLFVYVTLRNAQHGLFGAGVAGSPLVSGLASWRLFVVNGDVLVVLVMILQAFWSYWTSLV